MAGSNVLFGSSRLRRQILARFFASRGVTGHASQLARELHSTPQAVGRELDRLEQAGVLVSEHIGRVRRYRVDERSALAGDLRALVQKTVGAERQLSDMLVGLPGVDEAFIYGSYAARTDRPTSDIDVLVVGSVDPGRLAERVGDIERTIDRDINVHVYTRDEVQSLLAGGDRFMASVFAGPRISLLGR